MSGAQFRRVVKLAQKRATDKVNGDNLYLVRTGTHSDLF